MFLLVIFIINSTFTTFKKIKEFLLKGRTHGSLGECRMSIYDAELLLLDMCSNLKHNFTALGNNLYSLFYIFTFKHTQMHIYYTHTHTRTN